VALAPSLEVTTRDVFSTKKKRKHAITRTIAATRRNVWFYAMRTHTCAWWWWWWLPRLETGSYGSLCSLWARCERKRDTHMIATWEGYQRTSST